MTGDGCNCILSLNMKSLSRIKSKKKCHRVSVSKSRGFAFAIAFFIYLLVGTNLLLLIYRKIRDNMQPCQDRTAEFRERRLGRRRPDQQRRRPRHPRATHRGPRLCRHHFRAPATAGPHRSGCWIRHTRVSLAFLMRANDDCLVCMWRIGPR